MKIRFVGINIVEIDDLPNDINVHDLYLSNKLSGMKMYDVIPEKLHAEKRTGNKVLFEIPLKKYKYGNKWELKGAEQFIDQNIEVSGIDVTILSKCPIQFQFDFKVPNHAEIYGIWKDNSLHLSRQLETDEHILIKKRIQGKYIKVYGPNKVEVPVVDCVADISMNDVAKQLDIFETDIVDVFFKTSFSEELLKLNNNIDQIWIEASENVPRHKVYKTGAGSLAIMFDSRQALYTELLEWQDSQLILTVRNEESLQGISNVEIIEDTQVTSAFLAGHTVVFKVLGNQLFIDNEYLLNEMSRRNEFKFRFKISYRSDNVFTLFHTDRRENIISDDSTLVLENVSSNYLLSLKLTKKIREKTTKIAVLGSSHTRPMFQSSKYFNPDYKTRFEVVYTQFHSSIISIVSPGRTYDSKYFDNKPLTAQKYVQTDFDKTFFEKLRDANAEWLLVDIYIDVQMGIIRFGDGSVISYNTFQAESDYVAEHRDANTKLLTVMNDDEYLNKFYISLLKFREQLLQIFPENRVVIHAFDMSKDYLTKDGVIRQYNQSDDSIAQLDENATTMQSMVEQVFPNARILDIRDSKYHGYEGVSLGNSPHHFESDYYTELLNEFTKVITTYMDKN